MSPPSNAPSPALERHSHVQRLHALVRTTLIPRHEARFVGPLSVSTVPDTFRAQLHAFRIQQYQQQTPYLLSEEQQRLEARMQLDERSTHFVALRGEQLLATLRVTPFPFELAELTPELAQAALPFIRFAEFSRLVCEQSARGALLGTRLMGEACLWALEQGFEGVIALCKQDRRPLFERYGLSPQADRTFRVPSREHGAYSLMAGRWPDIITGALRTFQREADTARPAPPPPLHILHPQGGESC